MSSVANSWRAEEINQPLVLILNFQSLLFIIFQFYQTTIYQIFVKKPGTLPDHLYIMWKVTKLTIAFSFLKKLTFIQFN